MNIYWTSDLYYLTISQISPIPRGNKLTFLIKIGFDVTLKYNIPSYSHIRHVLTEYATSKNCFNSIQFY